MNQRTKSADQSKNKHNNADLNEKDQFDETEDFDELLAGLKNGQGDDPYIPLDFENEDSDFDEADEDCEIPLDLQESGFTETTETTEPAEPIAPAEAFKKGNKPKPKPTQKRKKLRHLCMVPSAADLLAQTDKDNPIPEDDSDLLSF
ncbi:hypothetical protein FPSE_02548 [Fusarium pseudograminearum CS3096]|uniref:Uncharacterized protein n=1 Tax=Fusarium pseudograminearum (strain CS3096) TaxID=1028729 RepID=K3VT95_FUSPC|nr:hypothetical protein FPSE_02548 [Fusarium pseudograminearum CS3096]EKJ77273.1 hypothetical protein FPSE_02548 [Fusarium pseudograminearum CS3096]